MLLEAPLIDPVQHQLIGLFPTLPPMISPTMGLPVYLPLEIYMTMDRGEYTGSPIVGEIVGSQNEEFAHESGTDPTVTQCIS
jgi:hypothetical protein